MAEDMSQYLDRLRRIGDEVRALQNEELGPAVDSSLQFCLHYLHLAHQFLGGTDLSAEIDMVTGDE